MTFTPADAIRAHARGVALEDPRGHKRSKRNCTAYSNWRTRLPAGWTLFNRNDRRCGQVATAGGNAGCGRSVP